MRKATLILLVAAFGAFALWMAGCSDSSSGGGTGSGTSQAPAVVSVYPSDGAANVPTSTPIAVRFNQAMDTTSVRVGFHFTGGDEMYRWLDSLDHHLGGMGGMGGMHMQDMQHMMDWMDTIQFPGDFHWNAGLDSCLFVPDSALMPGTGYMMFFYGDIESRHGMMMDTQDLPIDSVMYRFATQP